MRLATFSHERSAFTTPWLPALDSEQTVVLAFGSPALRHDPGPLLALRQAYPRSHLLGGSTAPPRLGARIADDALVVAVARFESTWVRTASLRATDPADAFGVAAALARPLVAPRLRGVLVIADAAAFDAGELERGLCSTLPASTPLAGILAGGDAPDGAPFVLHDGMPAAGRVTALALYGDSCSITLRPADPSDPCSPAFEVSEAPAGALLSIMVQSDGSGAAAGARSPCAARPRELPPGAQQIGLIVRSAFLRHEAAPPAMVACRD